MSRTYHNRKDNKKRRALTRKLLRNRNKEKV